MGKGRKEAGAERMVVRFTHQTSFASRAQGPNFFTASKRRSIRVCRVSMLDAVVVDSYSLDSRRSAGKTVVTPRPSSKVLFVTGRVNASA